MVPTLNALDPFNLVGLNPAARQAPPAAAGGQSLAASQGPGIADRGVGKAWHPDNGLFWFGGLLAATIGLVAVSTHVKVGPFKASAGLSK